ncbi:MAG TPA: alpha/beta fold hydrolase [Bacteroidales bacterium]|nr:alpha/beta fold hydrolase [Bacteroidales bacterium]HSA42856.1 alpha/beta fold hydrolase [Bacteroidales bacterium]
MELFFREYGQGQDFIILHGLFGLSDNWVTIARRIGEQFRVFVPDMRNHGQSPHHPVHSYPAMVADIEAFITSRVIRQPVVMGHSMGGKVAMQLALSNPELISRLIVLDISYREYNLRQQHLHMLEAMTSLDLTAVKNRREAEEHVAARIHERRLQQFVLKNLFRNGQVFSWRPNLTALEANLDLMAAGIGLQDTYPAPSLFIRGSDSDYLPDEDIPVIRKSFPAAQFQTISGAGHWLHADAPLALCRHIREFTGKECEFEG